MAYDTERGERDSLIGIFFEKFSLPLLGKGLVNCLPLEKLFEFIVCACDHFNGIE